MRVNIRKKVFGYRRNHEKSCLGKHLEIALTQKKNPGGQFYLKRIGLPATFHMSYVGDMDVERLFQSA